MKKRLTGQQHRNPLPLVLGSNLVGIAHHCDSGAEEQGFRPGSRVASLVACGSNARYVSIPTRSLIAVPKYLDAADIVSLISAYLPAFQALHHGRARPYRYSRTCLKNRKILIVSNATIEAQALIRLAKIAGATDVYFTAPRYQFAALERLGAKLLDADQWGPQVQGKMDVVIDYLFPAQFSDVRAALAPKGRLVCCSKAEDSSLTWLFEYLQLVTMKRATLFDFVQNFEENYESIREDFDFLLKLMSSRQIRPRIDRYVRLREIPKAHEDLQSQLMMGAIICHPWKD